MKRYVEAVAIIDTIISAWRCAHCEFDSAAVNNGTISSAVTTMFNKEQSAQVSDTSKDESSNTAKYIKYLTCSTTKK